MHFHQLVLFVGNVILISLPALDEAIGLRHRKANTVTSTVLEAVAPDYR